MKREKNIIEIKEEVLIPGTNYILEEGDIIRVLESTRNKYSVNVDPSSVSSRNLGRKLYPSPDPKEALFRGRLKFSPGFDFTSRYWIFLVKDDNTLEEFIDILDDLGAVYQIGDADYNWSGIPTIQSAR